MMRKSRTLACWLLCVGALAGLGGCSPSTQPEYGEPEVVVGPLPFLGVHGLAVAPDGRLLAGSVVGQSISEVDRETGEVSTLIGPPRGMADDIAFGPDGQMAWTSYLAGVLRARTGEGPVRDLATGLPGINSLAYDDKGRLFATQVFLADVLHEIDPEGEQPPRRVKKGMGGLNGFDFGPDGWLYGPLWFKGKVVRINVDTGEMQTVADGLGTPAAVNFDSRGNLYAVDTERGELVRIDVDTGETSIVAELEPSLDNLAIDGEDRIYVSNMADDSIQEVDPDTGEVRTVVDSELAAPAGLALVDGTLYIADTFAFRSLDTATGEVSEIGRMWASELEYPVTATATEDDVVLSSWTTGTVQVFDRKTLEPTRLLHDFKAPHDTLMLDDGSLLVAELGSGSLLRVSGEGESASREPVVEGLQGPAGLVMGADGTAWLTTAGGRVWALDTADWSKREVAAGLKLPEGIDVTPEGRLVVFETGARRIVSIDPETGESRVVARDLPVGLPAVEGLPPTGLFNDVVATGAGDLYYTADVEAGLYRIPRQ